MSARRKGNHSQHIPLQFHGRTGRRGGGGTNRGPDTKYTIAVNREKKENIN